MSNETSRFPGLSPEHLGQHPHGIYAEEAPRQFYTGNIYGPEGFTPHYDGQAFAYAGPPGYPESIRGTVVYAPEDETQEYDIITEPDGSSEFDDFLDEDDREASDVGFVPPRPKANGFFILCSALLGICLLAVSGYFGWDWYQTHVQGQVGRNVEHAAAEEHPKFIGVQAVEPIFTALKNGDGDVLMERWLDAQDLTEQERSLMKTVNYKNVEKRISGYTIREEVEYVDDDTGKVVVETVQDGIRKNVSLTLKRTGVDYGFYPVWQVTDFPLVSSATIDVDMEVPSVMVDSVAVPLTMAGGKASGSLRLLPGRYEVSVPEEVPVRIPINGRGAVEARKLYVPKGQAEIFKTLGKDTGDGEAKIEMAPSSYAKDTVQERVERYLYACEETTTADNPGCPFMYSNSEIPENMARNFSYEIVRQPVVDNIRVFGPAERYYVDAAGGFRWGHLTSSSAGRVRKSWEYNIGTSRKPRWQSRESTQNFSVNLDVIVNGDRIGVVSHR